MSLKKPTYRPRLIDAEVETALRTFGAVSIEGPKWCGKTWTGLAHANSVVYLHNPATNFNERNLAQIDVSSVLGGEAPAMIDEWQEVPAIWDGVRFRCDQTSKKGLYILTGSTTPAADATLHSGVGRIYRARMSTMSLFETGESTGAISLAALFGHTAPAKVQDAPQLLLSDIANIIIRGGWPQSINADPVEAEFIARGYIDGVLSSDMSRVDNVRRDVQKMRMVLRSLARNESTVANEATILRDIENDGVGEISRPTVLDYINVLDRLYLLSHQPAFSTNIRSSARVGKTDKRHFVDPSLPCAILGLNAAKLLDDVRFMGLLFESLCTRDLEIYASVNSGALYHYRDASGLEVDTIVELRDGRYGAIEIKLGTDQIDQAAANLLKFSESVERAPEFLAVVSGLATASYCRPDGVFVIPISALGA